MMSCGLSLLVLMCLAHRVTRGEDSLPVPVAACDSSVYCHGNLLDTIQRRELYDSKEFVDMSLKYDPSDVINNFSRLPNNATDQQLRQFVDENFNSVSDLLAWSPPDWVERPAFVDSIKDGQLREWALNVTAIWRELGRQLSPNVYAYPQRHSLIPVPNPFIVAGGRFSEYYYWDSYWIVRGLLLCEMYDTARGMIENLATLVDTYGMVPNGGRVYYSRRSQPPLLTQMVAVFYNATRNDSFVEKMLPVLEQEYQFWKEDRSVFLDSVGYEANHYAPITNQPRPESYLADINTSRVLTNETAKFQLFTNLASAAESGWDFSSRWLATEGPFAHQLASIRTTSIVPVDLNAILCGNEATLSYFKNITGNFSGAEYYAELMEAREEMFDEIFWNESSGTWRDFDITASKHLENFYLSSVAPLVWGCGSRNVSKELSTLRYLESAGFLDFPGGVPTSKITSGQQWDFPNAWPPLQWMLIYGLSQGSHETLRMAAKEAAQKWVSANWIGWKQNRTMFEKYDSEEPGAPGRGGEYVVQSGFGWTNGVILELLHLYGSSLSAPPLLNVTNSTNTTDTTNTTTDIPGTTNTTDMSNTTNTTNTNINATSNITSNSSNNSITAWVVPLATLVPLCLFCVVCIIWSRWLYKQGKRRYWQRVQNEHLMVYGATEDSGQGYTIGELYENKYFSSEHEEINNTHDNTTQGDEDGWHSSLNSNGGRKWYEQVDSTITAAAVSKLVQEDSGIVSNRTSDNISDSAVINKTDENKNGMPEEKNGDKIDPNARADMCKSQEGNSNDTASVDEQTVGITVVEETRQGPNPDKILISDV